jgi:hypothetical protein
MSWNLLTFFLETALIVYPSCFIGIYVSTDENFGASYFTFSQVSVRMVFVPMAGPFEGSVVRVNRLPSKL